MAFDESKIDPELLARRRLPGGCYCDEVGEDDGRCKHCGARVRKIVVGAAMSDIMLPRVLEMVGGVIEEAQS